MTTLFIMFVCGYICHLLYKGIDNLIMLIKEKRDEKRGVQND